jgi:hypothetical protein
MGWEKKRLGRENSPALTFLRKFPANREKYREFCEFWLANWSFLPVSSTFYWEKMGIHPKSEQGNNRGVSGIRDCLLRSWNREFT